MLQTTTALLLCHRQLAKVLVLSEDASAGHDHDGVGGGGGGVGGGVGAGGSGGGVGTAPPATVGITGCVSRPHSLSPRFRRIYPFSPHVVDQLVCVKGRNKRERDGIG